MHLGACESIIHFHVWMTLTLIFMSLLLLFFIYVIML